MIDRLQRKEEYLQRTSILKPHGAIRFEVFLFRRKWIAICLLAVSLVLLVLNYDTFYLYLTTLTFLMTTSFYVMLWLAHRSNGDYERKIYEEPKFLVKRNADESNVYAPNRSPWNQSGMIHMLYEFTMSYNTTVSIVFWLVELPFQGYYGWFDLLNTTQWTAYYLMHTIPQIVVIYEWFNSSIQLNTKNYWYTLFFSLPYTVMVAVITVKEQYIIYACEDWISYNF
jgi:hypothetical protein